MKLNENISRVKKLMGILEYVDIPLRKSGDTENIDRGPTYELSKENKIVNLFSGDFSQLKQFVQSIFPNQNLKYLGAGAMGMAFSSRGDLKLPQNFTDKDFYGSLPPEGTPVVLKLTTNYGEVEKIKKIIGEYGGRVPGVVSYYWIKELEIPQNRQWSTTLGAPSGKKPGQTKEMRIEDFKKLYLDADWFKKEHSDLTDEQLKKLVDRMFANYIKKKRKEDNVKHEKAFLICLDKIQSLPKELNDAIALAFEYYYWTQSEPETKRKGPRTLKPISVIDSVYTKEPVMKKYYDKRNSENTKTPKPSFENFQNAFYKIIKLMTTLNKAPFKLRDYDMHSGNIGLKGNDLVFFDLFV